MLTYEQTLEWLDQIPFVQEGHYVFTTGLHSRYYCKKDEIYPHTELLSAISYHIASSFVSTPGIRAVIAPALGGICLSTWTAHHLTRLTGQEVLALYAEKQGQNFVIRRGYDRYIPGQRILVLEDNLTTGGSLRKVIRATRALGGVVHEAGALCNRGELTAKRLHVARLESFLTRSLPHYLPRHCPLCQAGIPIDTTVGRGQEFLDRQAARLR